MQRNVGNIREWSLMDTCDISHGNSINVINTHKIML